LSLSDIVIKIQYLESWSSLNSQVSSAVKASINTHCHK